MIHQHHVSNHTKIEAIAMKSDIYNNLKEAKNFYNTKNYEKALEIYENLYNNHYKDLSQYNLISYCWTIYHVRVKNFTDENELFDSVELITDLIPQSDLNDKKTCPYTFSVLKVLGHLHKSHQYYNSFDWFYRLNPELLDLRKDSKYKRSRKEQFYYYLSKANLECAEWEDCIEASKKALNVVDEFTFDGDIWHHWNIAKALKELGNSKEALSHLKIVINAKDNWFIFKEIAENYYVLNDFEKALEFIPEAVLRGDDESKKVNLHLFVYNLLKDSNPVQAIKHAQLYCLLKNSYNGELDCEIEKLDLNLDGLNQEKLTCEIRNYWENVSNIENKESVEFDSNACALEII